MNGGDFARGFIVERSGAAEATGTLTGGLRRVAGEVLRIGRGTNADLRFEDPAVALVHARLERREDGLYAVDQGSVTGTYLNGTAIFESKLTDGDRLEIGGHGLTVRLQEGAPAIVQVTPQVAASEEAPPAAALPASPAGPAVAAREIDYVAAYRLHRGWFGKAVLSLALLAAAFAAVAWVASDSDRHVAFRPGDYSAKHQEAISTALEGEARATGCLFCHTPWKGSVDALCGAECHPANETAHWSEAMPAGGAGEAFHPALEPGCTECHSEHRGERVLKLVSNRWCVDCHGDLGAVLAAGTASRFAATVTTLDGHPPVSLDTAAGRVPLAEAEDTSGLRFDHAEHLVPNLLTADGERVQLVCTDCHRSEAAGEHRDLMAIEFEAHCERCHRLNFDAAAEPVEHRDPRSVRNEIRGFYSGDFARSVDVAEERRRAVTRRDRPRGLTGRSLEERVVLAELGLYETHCLDCHRIDMETTPFPTVEAPEVPVDWLPYSNFTHVQHFEYAPDLACVECHDGAAASKSATDVLLPALTVCQPCHGEAAAAREGRAPTPCRTCHDYHPPSPPAEGRVAASGG